jgi:hypothetical protein
MNRAFDHTWFLFLLVVVMVITSTGCNYPGLRPITPELTFPPATPSPAPSKIIPTEQSHIDIPFNPVGRAQTIHDQVNKNFASQLRAYPSLVRSDLRSAGFAWQTSKLYFPSGSYQSRAVLIVFDLP